MFLINFPRLTDCNRWGFFFYFFVLAVQLQLSFESELSSVKFSYTGDVQYFTVPSGITTIYLDIHGASGGTDYYGSPEYVGGMASRVQTTITVVPNTTYYIYIGLEGSSRPRNDRIQYKGGYNGGGSSGLHEGAGGGGASDFRSESALDAFGSRIVVAGGGGGGSIACASTGGTAGYPAGKMAIFGLDGCPKTALSGGNQTSGGDGGTGYGYAGQAGQWGIGGDGYHLYGGGGGGGYFGGGGGAYGGGAGGSSYCDQVLCHNPYYTVMDQPSNGSALITFADTVPSRKIVTTNPRLRKLHF